MSMRVTIYNGTSVVWMGTMNAIPRVGEVVLISGGKNREMDRGFLVMNVIYALPYADQDAFNHSDIASLYVEPIPKR